jgi:glyoxylase-like metal-dependent hydrolase (beta-lactamase superfamily II)
MLEGRGGNIAVSVGKDGLLIVDTQFAELAPQIEQALDSLDKGSLQYVLNTHWHGDHTGGNAHFGAKATVIAHEKVRQRLSEKSNTPDKALPVITFRESSSLFFNGEEIRMLHLGPGHSDGDAIIWFTQSNVIHMGGQAEGYLKNVQTVLNHLPEEAKIIPGHGKLATRSDLESFEKMMRESLNTVRQSISLNKSLDQIKASKPMEDYKAWGTGFINTSRWLEILYNSLTSITHR